MTKKICRFRQVWRNEHQLALLTRSPIRRLGNNIIIFVKNETAHLVKINNGLSVNQFGKNKIVGLGDISDISFEDGFLWAMDDDYPIFVRIDPTEPVTSPSISYTFDPNKYSFDEDARYYGMAKHGDFFTFFRSQPEIALTM